MSAHILGDENIDVIISSVASNVRAIKIRLGDVVYDTYNVFDRSKLGGILKQQNYRSVNYRYQETSICSKYTFTPRHLSKEMHPEAYVLKLLDCYEYQSCETPDYKDSQAKQIVETIRKQMISKLPGYSDAPWGL